MQLSKIALLVVPFCSASAALLSNAAVKERPLMKVVRMLQDMKGELQVELNDDKAVHDKLSCWCDINDKEKTKAIELAGATITQLESTMDEAVAKIMELKEKRKGTLAEVNADHAALTKADALRMKENKAFQGEETDLMEAVAACKQAVVVLSKHNPALAQVQAIARRLQNARAAQMMLSSQALPLHQVTVLKDFLQVAGTASSFLAIPGFQSYAPQSGQIFGILRQMQEQFESGLSGAQKAELKAREDYEALKAAKQEEIAAGQKAIVQIDADLADFSEKHAQAAQELEDTKAQMDLDTQFLADLKGKCNESAAEYETRVKNRLDEISAVEETIGILNSDEAFDVFDKAVNTAFVQTEAVSQEDKKRRERAGALLRRAADVSKTPQLALIAASVQLDAFTKVKEEIDKLVAELGKQMTDEVAQRDWCTDELASNDRSTAGANDKKASLDTKMADLGKTIESLTANIDSANAAIAEMQTQMKRASENREADNADYQQTISDQRLTQSILQKAIVRMKEVYALLQDQPGAAHIATSGNHTSAGNGPARFKEYEQNAGGSRVVAMLSTVLTDSQKLEDDAITAEVDAQTAYESFMKDSNKSITRSLESIANMSRSRSKAKEAKSMADTDQKQTMTSLQGLSEMNADIHKSCDFVLNNFDARQAARSSEIDALKEAKAILSGMQ